MYSEEHKKYLKDRKRKKVIIVTIQLLIILLFILIWQLLANLKLINTFLFSSPYNILKTIIELSDSNLLNHISITLYEILLSFFIASLLGLFIATIMWFSKTFADIITPFLNVINSLPKVALGPLIIIWFGTNIDSIIVMSLMISLILCIINIYNSFISTEESYITLLKSLKASKWKIYTKVIIPANKMQLFSVFKINVSMSLIGVIMGELLVSKKGLGYLIMYGSQVFNINLVITSVFILGVISYIIYLIINKTEKILLKK